MNVTQGKKSDQAKNKPAPADEDVEFSGDLSLLETIQSVLWAMLGVQKGKNAKRDFRHGSPAKIIAVGVIFGILFVVTLIVIVNIVLKNVAGI